MANTLRATTQFSVVCDYQRTETIKNPQFAPQISFGNTYVDNVSTGLKGNLLYSTVISLTSGSTVFDFNSYTDMLGTAKDFARVKSLTMKCTNGVGQARFAVNASGIARNMLDALDTGAASVRIPLESGRCVHYESATTAGYAVVAGDNITFSWTSGTFTVYLAIVGVDS